MSKTGFFCAFGLLLYCSIPCTRTEAQTLPLDELPALRDRAMVLQITTKIEQNSQEIWNSYNSEVTVPGRPVSIRLVGENLVVAIQFTPYLREGRYALVAQGQIWINIPDRGMSYKATTHSIPMDIGEPILYFPLGSNEDSNTPHIELILVMYRYGEEPDPGSAGATPRSSRPEEQRSRENRSGDRPPRRPPNQ